MGFGVNGIVEGVPELLKQLKDIDKKLRSKYLRQGVQAATKPVYDAAKVGAKEHAETGTFWKSLGRKVKIYNKGGYALGMLGVRQGFGKQVVTSRGRKVYRNPAKYVHLLELGHAIVKRGGKTKRIRGAKVDRMRTGSMVPAYHILRNAWIKSARPAREAIKAALTSGLADATKGK